MKKFFGIFAAVFALTAIVFSCQKAEMDEPQAEKTYDKVETVLTAVLEPRTKVALDFPNLSWEDQDQIAVFDGEDPKPNVFTYEAPAVEEGTEEGDAATKAVVASRPSFSGAISEGADATLYAVYPYNKAATYANGKITTTIPAAQVVPEGGNIDKSALLCVASTTTDELNFKNVLGLVKVTVPDGMKIARITLRGKDNETLAGTGTIEVTDTPKFDATEAATSITLTYADNGVFPKGEYYLAVAPVEFKNGFTISFTKVDAKTALKEATKSNTVARNGGLDTTKDLLTTLSWVYEITNKTDLLNWGANWGRYDHVILMADIDMENELWTPVGDGNNWFCGVFDGNEKKIYNFNVNTDGYAGLIGHLAGSGCVKNLTIGSKDGTNYDGKSAIVHTPSKDENGWNYVGAIAKAGDHAVVEGVTNFAKVVIPESEFKVKACMGGVVGFHAGSGEINTCVNRAELNFLAADGPDVSNVIGGIVSKLDGVTKVSSCDNYGKITNKNAKVFYIGGIVGNTRSNNYKNDKPSTIQTCKNEGAIEVLAASADSCGIGGICGMLQNANISTCTNTGKITLSTTSATEIYIGGIAGMRRNSYDTSITACVNGVENMSSSLFEYNTTGGDLKFGGILGHCHKSSGKLTITGCTNHSPISLSVAGATFQVGGISGALWTGVLLNVSECHNKGNVSVSSTVTANPNVGGLFGALNNTAETLFSITNCENSGSVTSSATGGAQTNIAGIAGYVRDGVEFISCTNKGAVSTTGSATNPRMGGVCGVAGDAGNYKGTVKFSQCINIGTITNASNNGKPYVGGIAGYTYESNVQSCSNKADITVSAGGTDNPCVGGLLGQCAANVSLEKSSNEAKVSCSVKKSRLGGIVGNADGVITIADCENKSTAVILNSGASGTYVVGGIVGRIYKGGSQILRTTNRGTVKAEGNQSCLVGGIVGVSEGGNATETQRIMDGCKNYGSVTTGNNSAGYACLGGMVGKTLDGMLTIKNCENHGPVAIVGTRNNNDTSAGGIIGLSAHQTNLDNNLNTAAITASVTKVKVGGIWGFDYVRNATNYTLAGKVKNCTNKGEIMATATTMSVGGLFGIISKTSVENGTNSNYGNVTCAGGALAGSSEITWSGLVGKTVTVNSNAGAVDAPETSWLCPAGTGTVTATYVDAIQ